MSKVKIKMRIKIVLYIVFLYLNSIHSQCLLIETNIETLTNKSELIIEGRVLSSFSTLNQEHNYIFTLHEVEVYGKFKGEKSENIYIATKGGIVGDRMIKVNPELELKQEDLGIFFLNETKDLDFLNLDKKIYVPSYNAQSFFKYDEMSNSVNGVFLNYVLDAKELDREIESFTSEGYVKIKKLKLNIQSEQTSSSRMISSFTPTTITAGTKSVLTINGSGFGASGGSVQFKYASDGGVSYIAAQSFEVLTWSNTQITVEVPDDAGTGTIRVVTSSGTNITSTSSLIVASAQILIYDGNVSKKTRHSVTAAAANKIIYTLNTSFNSNVPAKESFLRAMKTWRCENSVNWDIESNTSSIASSSNDDVNIISFGNAGGALAVTSSYFNGCSSGGGPTIWHLTEMDIIFETNTNWNFSTNPPGQSQIDFESVALHELGHSLLLGHIIDGNKVMHFSIANQQMKRDPSSDENAAVADVMSRSTTNSTLMCGFFKLNYAPNLAVTTTSDSGPGSLRQAVIDVCENDTIVMSLPASSTIALTSAELTIDRNMKIHGLSQTTFNLSGNNQRRIFNIQAGKTLGLQNLKLINATAVTNGGAILNSGILNLKNVSFQNNFQNGVRKAFTSLIGSTVSAENSVIINN